MIMERYRLKQTVVTITAQKRAHVDAALEEIKRQRHILENFIDRDPFFTLTLEPYDIPLSDAPFIVQEMARAGSIVGIGPMSAVAGTIARFALEAMIDAGATCAIVDNGGDIALINEKSVMIGIYAGTSPLENLAFELPSKDTPLGICTSSGTVGPSMSFGFADAALAISKDISLADAAATALGNAVSESGHLESCFDILDETDIQGALVIRGDEMALWGSLPKIKRATLNPNLITRA